MIALLFTLYFAQPTEVVGWKCTNSSQCGTNEVCIRINKNEFLGRCAKIN